MSRENNKKKIFRGNPCLFIREKWWGFRWHRELKRRITPEKIATLIRRVNDFPDDFLEPEDDVLD